MERNDFWKAIPDDCKKAISELKRLKVFRLLGLDYEETFADVWWLVLHEVDLYEEGEFCKEASRCAWNDPQAMDIRQAKAADRWLVKWNDLFQRYAKDELHSEFWHEHHSPWGDGDYYYGGQLID